MFPFNRVGNGCTVESEVMHLCAVGAEIDNQRLRLVQCQGDASRTGYLGAEAVGKIEMQLVSQIVVVRFAKLCQLDADTGIG